MTSNPLNDNKSKDEIQLSKTNDVTANNGTPASGAITGELRSRNVRLTVYLGAYLAASFDYLQESKWFHTNLVFVSVNDNPQKVDAVPFLASLIASEN